jgi:hypothetical protein
VRNKSSKRVVSKPTLEVAAAQIGPPEASLTYYNVNLLINIPR